MKLSHRDKQCIWHPFTQEKTAQDVIAVARAQGSYLYDEQNKPYLDLISSWWVNLHGHGHPAIALSLYEQALNLEHVLFAGFTHEPAVALCEGLKDLLPAHLNRFFFSDNGSTSVEVALKMAYQYWHNQGEKQRTFFLSFDGGYHGDTLGAMSVGSNSGFHDTFSELFFKVMSLPYPFTWEGDDAVTSKENEALAMLEDLLQQHGETIAAIILEPLVQGASGMRCARVSFFNAVLELVRKHRILVIFDEVMTGFGRTGTYFALSQLSVTPDFLCISKGITGGFLPLALTITTQEIYNAFLSDEWKHAFAHGHSYTGNPLACRAAVTSLNLLKEKACQQSLIAIHEAHQEGINFLKSTVACIEKTRIIGTISAFDIRKDVCLPSSFKEYFLKEGLLIRPLGRTVYLLPPYCISTDELAMAYEKIAWILQKL